MKDILLILLYSALFVLIIYIVPFFGISNIKRKYIAALFIAKVLASIVIVLIYTYYYTDKSQSDIYKYYYDGNVLYSALKDNPNDYFRMLTGINANTEDLKPYYTEMGSWFKAFNYGLYNDNRTIIRFNAVFRIFSFGSIYVHNIFMSFLAFLGLTALSKVFIKYIQNKQVFILIAVFLMPSVLLWSSANLKEGIVLFAFGFLFYGIDNIINKQKIILSIIFIALSSILLIYSKFYVFIAAIPGIVFLIWLKINCKEKFILLKFLAVHILFFGLIMCNHLFLKLKPDVFETIAYKQNDFINFAIASNAGSYIEIPKLSPDIISFIKATPTALLNSLFRPFITDVHSVIMIPAFIETYLIIIFLILGIIYFDKTSFIKNKTLFYFSISFVSIILLLTGLTTPVLGALVRYKVPALPFIGLIIIILTDDKRLKKLIKKPKYYE